MIALYTCDPGSNLNSVCITLQIIALGDSSLALGPTYRMRHVEKGPPPLPILFASRFPEDFEMQRLYLWVDDHLEILIAS